MSIDSGDQQRPQEGKNGGEGREAAENRALGADIRDRVANSLRRGPVSTVEYNMQAPGGQEARRYTERVLVYRHDGKTLEERRAAALARQHDEATEGLSMEDIASQNIPAVPSIADEDIRWNVVMRVRAQVPKVDNEEDLKNHEYPLAIGDRLDVFLIPKDGTFALQMGGVLMPHGDTGEPVVTGELNYLQPAESVMRGDTSLLVAPGVERGFTHAGDIPPGQSQERLAFLGVLRHALVHGQADAAFTQEQAMFDSWQSAGTTDRELLTVSPNDTPQAREDTIQRLDSLARHTIQAITTLSGVFPDMTQKALGEQKFSRDMSEDPTIPYTPPAPSA